MFNICALNMCTQCPPTACRLDLNLIQSAFASFFRERIRKFFQKYPGACMEAGKSYMIYKYKYMYMYV